MIYHTNLFAFNQVIIASLNVTMVKMHSCLGKTILSKKIQLCRKLDGISGKM